MILILSIHIGTAYNKNNKNGFHKYSARKNKNTIPFSISFENYHNIS